MFVRVLGLFPFPFRLHLVNGIVKLDHVPLIIVQLFVILQFIRYFLEDLVIGLLLLENLLFANPFLHPQPGLIAPLGVLLVFLLNIVHNVHVQHYDGGLLLKIELSHYLFKLLVGVIESQVSRGGPLYSERFMADGRWTAVLLTTLVGAPWSLQRTLLDKLLHVLFFFLVELEKVALRSSL